MIKNLIKKVLSVVAITFSIAAWSGAEASAQEHRLTGTVLDGQGVPVIGASILIEGTSSGVVTDADGKYVFDSISPDATIIVSCLGYVDQRKAVGGATVLNFTLSEDAELLEDVVVIGYGVQKKSDVTGAISSVKGDALANRSVETVQQALQGKVAGVQVYSGSAAPGADPQIRVRGISSNSSGATNPLYVVDGLKVSSIGYLDPTMIESMEILKDGASAAIYGAEAGNGVVLITTKQGAKGQDGHIFYDFSYGFTSLARKADLMNAEQYVAYQTAAGNGTTMSAWDGVTDTDWADALYGDGGHIQRHTVGFEGGNDKGSLYAAMSYLDNDGMYYGDKDYMKRVSLQLNASYDIKPWLNISTNNTITYSDYERTGDGIDKQHYNSPYFYDPLTPTFYDKNNLPAYMQNLISQHGDDMFMKNENGDYAAVPQFILDSSNPMTWYYSQDSRHRDFNTRGITAVNFKPVKGLVVTTRLGYNINSSDYSYYGKPVYFSISSRTTPNYNAQTSTGYSIDWENFINYNNTFGKHSVSAMVGMAYHYGWSNFTSGSTNSFTSDADNFHYLNYSTSDASDSVGGEESENSNVSYFGRVGYTYDDRYSVQVSFRADAYDVSKLSPESRWGYFPSVSVGWTVSNEHFMSNVSRNALSFLKVRASYGENGNVNVLGGYRYGSSLTTGDYYPMSGSSTDHTVAIKPSDVLANPSLRWETSKQWDAGIDARFLNDRLSFTMDFYNKNTSGQLISMTPPLSSGATSVTRNVGLVNNHGFEFDLGWKDNAGDFYYSIDANIATLSNEVKSIGDNSRIQDSASNGLVYFDAGQPVWSYYGYKYLGPDHETGEAVYQDTDKSGDITEADKVFLGSAIPTLTYGLTFNAAYKGFDLTIFGSGSAGGEIMFNTRSVPQANRPAEMWTESWSVKGAGAKYPKPAVLTDTYMYLSDMQMYDGSYFKIKQIALGYSLPERLLKKIYVSKLRVYVSLDNFFCFTKYPGMDPETINASSAMGMDYGDYPTPKTVTVGVNLSF